MKKAVVLLSGGLDSATVAARAIADGHEVIALSFNYGQRNLRELTAARVVASALGVSDHFVIDVNLASWSGSALTEPGGEMSAGQSYYVPGRNTVFIALALSLAEARGAEAIYLGFTKADAHYPDTQPAYVEQFARLAGLSSKVGRAGTAPRLVTPLIDQDKPAIVREALRRGVPIAATWSCYADRQSPCGDCMACRIRDRALIMAGCPDLATKSGLRLHEQEAEAITSLLWRFLLFGVAKTPADVADEELDAALVGGVARTKGVG